MRLSQLRGVDLVGALLQQTLQLTLTAGQLLLVLLLLRVAAVVEAVLIHLVVEGLLGPDLAGLLLQLIAQEVAIHAAVVWHHLLLLLDLAGLRLLHLATGTLLDP